MFDKIEIFSKRYDELNNRLYDQTVASDATKFNEIMKEVKSIEPIVLKYREYKKAQQTIKDSLEILETEKDKEIRELAQMEMDDAKDSLDGIEEELKILLHLKTLTMKEMLLWKFVVVQVVKKVPYLQVIFSECTLCMPISMALRLKFFLLTKQA